MNATRDTETPVVQALFWLAGLAKTRLTGSPEERAVQQAIAERLERAGYTVAWQPFRFPPHIYGGMAMHFGLALALLWVGHTSPGLAALGLLAVWVSFYVEVTRRRHLLRKLWPSVATQNLLATLPSRGPLRRRIVLLAHVDSAYTGLMFDPAVLRVVAAPPPKALPFLRKQLALPMATLLALAALHALAALGIYASPMWLTALLAIPVAIVFLVNADVVLRNTVVPGAADNLSGCAAQVVLAEQWARERPDGVEVVFAFTGAEEAGTGGAAHLASLAPTVWDPANTDIFVLDTLSNGELFALEEGELFRVPQPPALLACAQAASREAVQKELSPYIIPAGATDALPFLVAGYRALALTCIDPVQHAPRNYHHPNDTAERVDPAQLEDSTRVAWAMIVRRSLE
jgi:acetylornithine deacetylase/succinyl-diaminopimelate desuccinylase-like protein